MIRAARAGDARAHEAIYRACRRPVYTLIRRLVPRAAIAEELFQETFVEILRSIGAYSRRRIVRRLGAQHRGEQVPDVPALAVASQPAVPGRR